MNHAVDFSKGICQYKRLKLSRNIEGHVFTAALTTDQSLSVKAHIESFLPYMDLFKQYKLEDISLENRFYQKQLIREGLLATDPFKSNLSVGLKGSFDQRLLMSFNDLDHLRLIMSSDEESFDELWQTLDLLDDELSQSLEFSYLEPYGYLTSRIEQLGTALNGEALLHLPALKRTGFINALSESLGSIGVTIKPWESDFYLVYNTVTLGRSEVELALLLDQVVEKLSERERAGRETLWASEGLKLKDKIGRAYGQCQFSAVSEFDEALQWVSELMLGEAYGLLVQSADHQEEPALKWMDVLRQVSDLAMEAQENKPLNHREKTQRRSERLQQIHGQWKWRG